MKSHHLITKHESSLDTTLDLRKALGARVLSHKGLILGKVSKIRIHPTRLQIEGIVISRGIFEKPFYIGSSYIKRFSEESFILTIELSVLLKGKKVLTSNGKVIGKIKDVIRKKHSNEVDKLSIKSFLKKIFYIRLSDVQSFGESIILKSNYRVPKKYLWQKSE